MRQARHPSWEGDFSVAWARLFMESRLKSFFLETTGYGSYCFAGHAHVSGDTCAPACPSSSWRRIMARRNTRADSRPLVSIEEIRCRSFLTNFKRVRWEFIMTDNVRPLASRAEYQ